MIESIAHRLPQSVFIELITLNKNKLPQYFVLGFAGVKCKLRDFISSPSKQIENFI
jgi:hypothetical protein